MTDFDRDPEALAWARAKIQRHIDQCAQFEQQGAERGDPELALRWRRTKNYMRMKFIGGRGCVIASFDERLPEMKALLDTDQPTEGAPA